MEQPVLNAVDITVIILVALGALNGLRRGLSGELAATVSALLALLFGLVLYQPVGSRVAQYTRLSEQPAIALALTFLLAVAAATVGMLLIRIIIKHAVTVVINNKGTDRLGGMLAGSVQAAVLLSIAILAINMWPHEYLNRVFRDESLIGRNLMKLAPDFEEQLDNIQRALKEVAETDNAGND